MAGSLERVPALSFEAKSSWSGILSQTDAQASAWERSTRVSYTLGNMRLDAELIGNSLDIQAGDSIRSIGIQSRNQFGSIGLGYEGTRISSYTQVQWGSQEALAGTMQFAYRQGAWINSILIGGSRSERFHANWADTLLPPSQSPLDWSLGAESLHAKAMTSLDWKEGSVQGSLGITGHFPTHSRASHELRDSSLALNGSLGASHRFGNSRVHASLQSISGFLQGTGVRQSGSDEILFLQGTSGFGLNSAWISLTDKDDSLRIAPSSNRPRILLGGIHGNFDLLEPPGESRAGSFTANRLLTPGMADVLGYTFYRKTLFLESHLDLWAFLFKLDTPLWWNQLGLLSGLGIAHLLGHADAQGRWRTTQLFTSTSEPFQAKHRIDALVALLDLGLGYRPSPSSPWQIELRAHQYVPKLLDLTKNGKTVEGFHSSTDNAWFRNGFQCSLKLSYRD